MTTTMDDIDQLISLAKSLKRVVVKIEKNAGVSVMQMTDRMASNHTAKLAWDCMERDKLLSDAHAVAVDLGISPMRPRAHYDSALEFRPSAFHHYKHKIRKPRALIAEKNTGV